VSLVEVVVASALLGIGVVTALSALDTAGLGAHQAARQTWANCVLRNEAGAVLAAPYVDGGPYLDGQLIGTPSAGLQVIQVQVLDPVTGEVVASAYVYKSQALSGATTTAPASPPSCGSSTGVGT
jgi:hypothetical protein